MDFDSFEEELGGSSVNLMFMHRLIATLLVSFTMHVYVAVVDICSAVC